MFCLSNLIKESNRKTVISSFFILLQLPENQFTICFIRQHKATWWNVQLISLWQSLHRTQILIRKKEKKRKTLLCERSSCIPFHSIFAGEKNRTRDRVRDVS